MPASLQFQALARPTADWDLPSPLSCHARTRLHKQTVPPSCGANGHAASPRVARQPGRDHLSPTYGLGLMGKVSPLSSAITVPTESTSAIMPNVFAAPP